MALPFVTESPGFMADLVVSAGSGNQLVEGDYSFTTATTDQGKIVVLNGNTVVWGIEP